MSTIIGNLLRIDFLAVISSVLTFPLFAAEAKYDLIIRGGRIVDGTDNPWFHGDVAVNGDRIVSIGRLSQGAGKREIDAKGLIVAPGFIDMHSHSDWVLLEDGNGQSKIRQGVTTEVIGESSSAGPFKGRLKPRIVQFDVAPRRTPHPGPHPGPLPVRGEGENH